MSKLLFSEAKKDCEHLDNILPSITKMKRGIRFLSRLYEELEKQGNERQNFFSEEKENSTKYIKYVFTYSCTMSSILNIKII